MKSKINNTRDKFYENLAVKIFDDLANLTKSNKGVTRDSYGSGENRALKYLKNLASELGFLIEIDEAVPAELIETLNNISQVKSVKPLNFAKNII